VKPLMKHGLRALVWGLRRSKVPHPDRGRRHKTAPLMLTRLFVPSRRSEAGADL
jgi:hypothetical protein